MGTRLPDALGEADLIRGGLYRGKRPRRLFNGEYDDRVIIWGPTAFGEIQYDSYAVRDGRHYPRTTVEKFLRWASHRIEPIASADTPTRPGIATADSTGERT